MIYELMKREISWWVLPWYVLASAVICACPAPVSRIGVIMSVTMGLFVAFPHMHATRFNASLPILGRDLILARALFLMAMVWLPAMAGAAAASMFSGHSAVAGRALMVAALCTLAAGVVQSIRVRELAAPKWVYFPLWFIPGAAAYLEQRGARFLIPASCALAGIALLARAWSVVPKSFELAPAKPRHGDGPARPALQTGVASPRLVWLPVLRSVFTVPYSVMLAFLVFFGLGGRRLALSPWILVVWMMARLGTLWLRPLPIRPRALLITMTAPILLALAGGYFAALYPGPIPALPVQVLDLGALLAFGLAVVLAIELVDWRRLSHISIKVRTSVGVALMVVCMVGGFTGFGLMHGADPLHAAVLRLAQALPDSVALAMALVAAALAALWWALEKVFEEADRANKPRAPRQEYFAG